MASSFLSINKKQISNPTKKKLWKMIHIYALFSFFPVGNEIAGFGFLCHFLGDRDFPSCYPSPRRPLMAVIISVRKVNNVKKLWMRIYICNCYILGILKNKLYRARILVPKPYQLSTSVVHAFFLHLNRIKGDENTTWPKMAKDQCLIAWDWIQMYAKRR